MVSTRRTTQHSGGSHNRLKSLQVFVGIFALLLVYRLFNLQIVQGSEFQETAANQHATVRILPAQRGDILYGESKSGEEYPLATNREFFHVFVVPRDIDGIEKTFDALWPLVEEKGITEDILRYRLSKANDIYEPLLHKLTESELQPFKNLNLPGIEWEREEWRYYPEQETLSQVIGFVGLQDGERIGQYGLEGYFEEELKGVDGLLEGSVDITGRLIQTGKMHRQEPEEGVDLVLTIDRTIQSFACRELALQVTAVEAKSGSILIVDPKTGAILTMCSVPTYNPNQYNKVEDIGVYLNPTISTPYEPGSIFKPLTLAAAINEGKITPYTTFQDDGFVVIGEHTIKNFDGLGRGQANMIKVLEDSLNTGAIFAQQQIGNATFREYVEAFGFGELTGIELGGEAVGDIRSIYKKSDIYFATPSFGQGITTTPIQMVMSYAALANGGKLMKPYIIAEERRNGKVVRTTEPTVVSQPISLRASTMISGMLVSVIDEGYDKRGGVEGYFLAGKTGTAQVAERGVYGANTIHSFAGYGPVDNPAFAMLVKLDHPQKGRFASSTTAPIFGKIAEFILQYYEIPPDL